MDNDSLPEDISETTPQTEEEDAGQNAGLSSESSVSQHKMVRVAHVREHQSEEKITAKARGSITHNSLNLNHIKL